MEREMRCKGNRHPEGGFSLIETLVAMLVLAIGLMGLAGLQTKSIQANANARQTATANRLAEDVLEQMRANPNGAENGAYNIGFSKTASGYGKSPTALADQDLKSWLTRLEDRIPGTTANECAGGGGACGASINVTAGSGRAAIVIRWVNQRREDNRETSFRTESHL